MFLTASFSFLLTGFDLVLSLPPPTVVVYFLISLGLGLGGEASRSFINFIMLTGVGDSMLSLDPLLELPYFLMLTVRLTLGLLVGEGLSMLAVSMTACLVGKLLLTMERSIFTFVGEGEN